MSAPAPVHVCARCGKAYDPAIRPSPDSYAWSTPWADGVAFWMPGRGLCAGCFEARARGNHHARPAVCGFCGMEFGTEDARGRHEETEHARDKVSLAEMAFSRR